MQCPWGEQDATTCIHGCNLNYVKLVDGNCKSVLIKDLPTCWELIKAFINQTLTECLCFLNAHAVSSPWNKVSVPVMLFTVWQNCIESAAQGGAATPHRLFGFFLWLFVEHVLWRRGASCQKSPSAAWCRWVSVAKNKTKKPQNAAGLQEKGCILWYQQILSAISIKQCDLYGSKVCMVRSLGQHNLYFWLMARWFSIDENKDM